MWPGSVPGAGKKGKAVLKIRLLGSWPGGCAIRGSGAHKSAREQESEVECCGRRPPDGVTPQNRHGPSPRSPWWGGWPGRDGLGRQGHAGHPKGA